MPEAKLPMIPTEKSESEPTVLHGLRRDLTKEDFEELCALQCQTPEILGYTGTTEKKLRSWCRSVYHHPLPEMMEMIRQDGLITIRRASFDQLKKSATLINQQFVRFLSGTTADAVKQAQALAQQIFSTADPDEENVKELFE